MSNLGQLSPIDPSLPHSLSSIHPVTGQNIPNIAEDVSANIDLASESGLKYIKILKTPLI